MIIITPCDYMVCLLFLKVPPLLSIPTHLQFLSLRIHPYLLCFGVMVCSNVI